MDRDANYIGFREVDPSTLRGVVRASYWAKRREYERLSAARRDALRAGARPDGHQLAMCPPADTWFPPVGLWFRVTARCRFAGAGARVRLASAGSAAVCADWEVRR